MAVISAVEVTVQLRSYPTCVDEGTTVVSISCMIFAYIESCPLDILGNPIWWLISKPHLHNEVTNGIPIYWGYNGAQLPKLTYSNSYVWPAGLIYNLLCYEICFMTTDETKRHIDQSMSYNLSLQYIHFVSWAELHKSPSRGLYTAGSLDIMNTALKYSTFLVVSWRVTER